MAVVPSDGRILAPCDATVSSIYDTATMMILTNADDYDSAKKAGSGQVDASSVVMKIKKA